MQRHRTREYSSGMAVPRNNHCIHAAKYNSIYYVRYRNTFPIEHVDQVTEVLTNPHREHFRRTIVSIFRRASLAFYGLDDPSRVSPRAHNLPYKTCRLALSAPAPTAVVFARDALFASRPADALVCPEGVLALPAAAAVMEVLAWCPSEAGHRADVIVMGAPCVLALAALAAAVKVLAWDAEEADETHTVRVRRLNG